MKKARKRSGAPKLCARKSLEAGGLGIVGHDHARRAESLDPLIKAIGRSPRVEDDRLLSARCNHGHAGRVDISEFANLRINQAAATAMNIDRFLAEHPSGHVEVVNHHVAEETAGFRNILERGWVGIAAGNRQLFKIANLAILDGLLDCSVSGIKPPIEGQENASGAITQRIHALLRLRESRRQRLLTHHGLSRLNRLDDELGVSVR